MITEAVPRRRIDEIRSPILYIDLDSPFSDAYKTRKESLGRLQGTPGHATRKHSLDLGDSFLTSILKGGPNYQRNVKAGGKKV